MASMYEKTMIEQGFEHLIETDTRNFYLALVACSGSWTMDYASGEMRPSAKDAIQFVHTAVDYYYNNEEYRRRKMNEKV